jgi:YfiH family protein
MAPPAFFSGALAHVGVRHGFFARAGGVSTGIYAGLNAGTGSKDDPVAVAENRRRIAETFGAETLLGVHQVHSPDAAFVSGPWPGDRPHADALVTKTRGLVISVVTADCAPVLFADASNGVIGAAHAGWKGALTGVLESTVALMEANGAEAARISAAIGPCIHQTSYEVGPEFEARFLDAHPDYARYFVSGEGDRRRFDLPGFCASRLETLGLATVEILPLDTYPEKDIFFSHRRSVHDNEPDYGRNCAAIALD